MPKEGLWRAGRWSDVERFPPPPRSIHSSVWSSGPELLDGYRWEDISGRFSTVKLSASDEAAVGRTLARFRGRVIDGVSLLDKLKGFLSNPADNPTEPELTFNQVPDSYFEDAYLLHLGYDEDIRFIDVEHQRTRDTLSALLSAPLQIMGHDLEKGLSDQRDRRLTRLVTATLHELRNEYEMDHLAGLRYRAPDRHWDAYVIWDRPARVDLAQADSVEPLFPDHPAVQNAAKMLGLELPKS
jgi:hypothetical protein